VDKGIKNEKAGASTPATPSKVEGTQSSDQSKLDLNTNASSEEVQKLQSQLGFYEAEIASMREDLAQRTKQVGDLEAEHQEFKDKLKPEIEKIQAENKDLKGQVEKLQGELVKAGGKTEPVKTEGKFTVIASFRGNQDGEGIFNIGDDVSHLSAERLKSLVDRELVKEG
jgi:chromosome segregation ATPase